MCTDITNLGVFVGTYHQNQKLIHCVLSGSDVWRKLGVLNYSTSNNKTPALLAYKTLLSLQLLERRENDRLRTTG